MIRPAMSKGMQWKLKQLCIVLSLPIGLSGCMSEGDVMSVVAAGASGNKQAVLGTGVQLVQNAQREQAARDAAAREAARVAELQKTSAGRAQLAREREEQRQQAAGQAQLVAGLAAAFMGGLGGGSSDSGGYNCNGVLVDDPSMCQPVPNYSGGSSPSYAPPAPAISPFYDNNLGASIGW